MMSFSLINQRRDSCDQKRLELWFDISVVTTHKVLQEHACPLMEAGLQDDCSGLQPKLRHDVDFMSAFFFLASTQQPWSTSFAGSRMAWNALRLVC